MSFGGVSATIIQSVPVVEKPALPRGTGTGKTMDPDDMGTKQARVVLDYDAVMPNEMTVKQNDILIVYRLPGLDADFVMGEKGGVRGRVPISYLEIL